MLINNLLIKCYNNVVPNNKKQTNNYLVKAYARIARNNNIPIDQVSSYLKDEL